MVERRRPRAWLEQAAPPELADPAAIAAYGETVRAQVAEWLARSDAVAGTIETYYGPQTGHELLKRTVWHAAQHVRQLHAFLKGIGVRPADPLTQADLAGLPLPGEVS